ncbi:MAG: glycoside hydrolase family 30 protein [Clostridia bacterium]|nr:glycoside hydrolase family 30 protein [Clostridia bacterium]
MPNSIVYDIDKTYQTFSGGFGTSGCWWAPDVGGWRAKTEDGEDIREAIARLLYDKESGLGMSVYRYNVGAAVTRDRGRYSHYWRTVESFLTADGSYDFNRDKDGQYMLDLALKYGADQVVLFANSPPNSMTINGKGHSSDGNCNLAPENYSAFAKYMCDIAEYFVGKGVPVVSISPVNEPEWEWKGGQEGCHFEPKELKEFYKVFILELESRPVLKGIKLSAFESGVMAGRIYEYIEELMSEPVIKNHLDELDVHSYWSTSEEKKAFNRYIENNYPELSISVTEWCQMQNGRRADMNTAFTIANVIMDDLTLVNATSWQHWLGVSCYHYEDGLLYVSVEDKDNLHVPLRYYAYAQFTRYIQKGAVRVASNVTLDDPSNKVRSCSFINPNGDLVTVFINEGETIELFNVGLPNEYNYYETYSTDVTALERANRQAEGGRVGTAVTIPALSITTIVYKK